ncbi:MAG: hypothetical protein ABH952_00455 [Candidatus Omnitrophota bacterium]
MLKKLLSLIVQNMHLSQESLRSLWWALLFGACFGGNITAIGSTANIVALGLLEKEQNVKINFFAWLKIGLISGMVTMAMAYGIIAFVCF